MHVSMRVLCSYGFGVRELDRTKRHEDMYWELRKQCVQVWVRASETEQIESMRAASKLGLWEYKYVLGVRKQKMQKACACGLRVSEPTYVHLDF